MARSAAARSAIRAWLASASASGPSGADRIRRQVVRRQRAGELVVAERFEVARRREVPAAPVAQREGGIGDLADDGLDECVLAPFR